MSPTLAGRFFTTEPPAKALFDPWEGNFTCLDVKLHHLTIIYHITHARGFVAIIMYLIKAPSTSFNTRAHPLSTALPHQSACTHAHTHAHACTCTHTHVHSLRKTAEAGPGSTQVLYFLYQYTYRLTSNRSGRSTVGIRADSSGVLGPDSTD